MCNGSIAQVSLAEAHENLFVVVYRVCASIHVVIGSTLYAHTLYSEIVIWMRMRRMMVKDRRVIN